MDLMENYVRVKLSQIIHGKAKIFPKTNKKLVPCWIPKPIWNHIKRRLLWRLTLHQSACWTHLGRASIYYLRVIRYTDSGWRPINVPLTSDYEYECLQQCVRLCENCQSFCQNTGNISAILHCNQFTANKQRNTFHWLTLSYYSHQRLLYFDVDLMYAIKLSL